MLASAIALPVLSGAAWAGGGEDFGCSNAVLKGEYAFGVTTYSPVPGVVAGIKVFDGNGNLTQRDYIGDSSPAEFAPKGQETGTYTVNSDCTGTATINYPDGSWINLELVVVSHGREFHTVVSSLSMAGVLQPANIGSTGVRVENMEGH